MRCQQLPKAAQAGDSRFLRHRPQAERRQVLPGRRSGGLGPFVSVYLVTAAGWTAAEIGAVLTISGLIGITLHMPVGAMIDAVRDKRLILVAGVVLLAASAIAIQQAPFIPVVFLADVVMAVLGGVFAPTMAALTLGLVPESAFLKRLARNTVWDRLGNLFIAAVSGLVGWIWLQRSILHRSTIWAGIGSRDSDDPAQRNRSRTRPGI